jgi:hypothetical protein
MVVVPWYERWWDFLSGSSVHVSPIGWGVLAAILAVVLGLAMARKR